MKFATLLLAAMLMNVHAASAQWQKLQALGSSFDCGFAIDDQTVLIGSGKGVNFNDLENKPAQIYKSTDGGANWHLTVCPMAAGAVTSIFMKDALTGYATIFPFPNVPSTVLWKTTDGGENWTDLSQAISGSPTTVYATSKAIVLSLWYDLGGSSTDGDNSFSHVLGTTDNAHTNGVDFTDDNTGVISVFQSSAYPAPFYYTSDGGLTWNASSAEREAWSVYGKKCTQKFFTANEDSLGMGHVIHWSSDGGRSWSVRFSFADPKMQFTGHIAGRLNTLYLQTDIVSNEGMFRSDDLGLSWMPIGGPSNNRDTRFVVGGSHGQIVYAFDQLGGIWKTTTGGDGTLQGGPVSSSLISITADSTVLVARNCNPDTLQVDTFNFGCSGVTIDSATIAPNTLGEFDLQITNPSLEPGEHASIVIHFTPKNATSHNSLVHVYAHSSMEVFDTIFSVIGIDRSPSELYFGPALAANIGDTVDVPIYLAQTNNTFTISSLEATYNFDGDILTPVAIETRNTLMAGATNYFATGSTLKSSIIHLDLPSALSSSGINFATPFFIVRMRVTLSKSTATEIVLSTLAINNVAPAALCAITSVPFQAILRCGDSTIKTKLTGGDVAKLLRAQPNPMSRTYEDVWYELPNGGVVDLDLIDEQGNRAKAIVSGLRQTAGSYHFQFNSSLIAGGTYFLRLSVGGAVASTYKLLQEY